MTCCKVLISDKGIPKVQAENRNVGLPITIVIFRGDTLHLDSALVNLLVISKFHPPGQRLRHCIAEGWGIDLGFFECPASFESDFPIAIHVADCGIGLWELGFVQLPAIAQMHRTIDHGCGVGSVVRIMQNYPKS